MTYSFDVKLLLDTHCLVWVLTDSPQLDATDQAFANGLRPLPIPMEPLLVSCELRHRHGGPFDRILYAQAHHGGFRLLSIDRTLATFRAVVITPK